MDWQIKEGDCLEVLRKMEMNTIDLTVTSPPYDDLRSYSGLPFDKFQSIASELYRVTKKGGVVVWVVADATVKGSETGTSFRQALFFKDCGFNLHDTMIWRKGGAPFQHANRYISEHEFMFIFSKGAPKTANLIRDRKNKWGGTSIHGTDRQSDHRTTAKAGLRVGRMVREYGARFNTWEIYPEQRNDLRKQHPAIFPEQLAADHIRSWSNEGDLVLDPFVGSGTTGKMAIQLKRRFIGIEQEQDYISIAKMRCLNAVGEE